ncbi:MULTISPECIES: hypothetical protein [Streptomyces]|uniref:Uncharacterized protein n=1 Tax=Streptomyces flaveolus TaxID=67297 RepID=A0ABV1VTK0_9ACTN
MISRPTGQAQGPEVGLPSGDEPEDFLGGTAVLPNGHAWGLDDDSWLFLCQFKRPRSPRPGSWQGRA